MMMGRSRNREAEGADACFAGLCLASFVAKFDAGAVAVETGASPTPAAGAPAAAQTGPTDRAARDC